ncbi:SAM-dependent methyltransferase [Candidatus Desantisbacteria bacterium CG1_02_38_46]|uniref:SAM-dependent methyltransferase n=3 Tax=unclassified Candidatus Desantisiibacteriota TaxID=3106372 RepID=A0A2H9PDR1_9BACT|nr:MAG: SAM-dependent methyltransferase [Candidatus Desantisbacteria bacterium CG1_02_38_46]PIU50898.1 MAG: SAM-dependent methyltransferase [Candidatus Desantisbacteria bacterium CG07_land_8_20_14_0_80_39_15]PIZ16630.1 MAG: SAM-dependent methyltransferase [Candidatus Desantisbacteria bacterium CG_4_10_14_0_8_um_filter_39_17]
MDIFNVYAKRYDDWYEKNKFAYLSELKVLKYVIPQKGKGLEIGVGTGRFAEPLGIKVGIDPSKKMLKFAFRRNIKTFVGKGEHLPFKNGEFDFILIVITLCFVDNPEKVIAESKRVLRDKGKLIIGIIDKNSKLGKFYQKKKSVFYRVANFFSPEEVINLLKNNGFKSIVTFQTIFDLPENIKKVEKHKRGYGKGGFVVVLGKKRRNHAD